MNIHTDAPTLIDRVALSNSLYELAESFALEATLWTVGSPMRAELERSARLLAELARHVLTGRADHAKAEAFLDGGQTRLAEAQSIRRFRDTLNTPPRRTKGANRD
ncbi:hypothetical protein AUC47_04945 [Microbacterium sp. SZ1]|uniref:hypothetical protein n=1 Tax=Microbacterium sp. SZ1 TaxID=1849736 RepID=UPI000BBC977C|nr:hypothetical protein [Microbacterium sp. SZ1]PCE13998.1 hypothetical protein AUC47_04945 [Microbacterium sp. SZ1]